MTQEHNNNTRTHVQLWTLNHCKSPDILCRLFRRKPAESVACYSKLGTPIWEFKKKFMFLWGFKAQPNNKRSPALLTNQWESGELYIMPVLWFISHVGVHHKSFTPMVDAPYVNIVCERGIPKWSDKSAISFTWSKRHFTLK